MNRIDLALNNLQWLMCHKTELNQTKQVLQKEQALIIKGTYDER